jgi:RNA polymerase sigma-70 factor (ECF subfamily)
MLGNKEDAEDAAQEALLKGFSNIDELRDSERFGTWIAGIAKNLCVDHIRRRRRKRRFHRLWVTQPEASSSEYSGLEKALCELPEDYRVALMLYYFDGRSAKNIAEALDVSEATVCARLSRARNRLRELLDRQGDE